MDAPGVASHKPRLGRRDGSEREQRAPSLSQANQAKSQSKAKHKQSARRQRNPPDCVGLERARDVISEFV